MAYEAHVGNRIGGNTASLMESREGLFEGCGGILISIRKQTKVMTGKLGLIKAVIYALGSSSH